MAKHNCAICGAEVGLLTGQKLADGNYVCKKVCGKKTFKLFDMVPATLGDVTAHIAQVEKGTKIWQELLLPLKKSKNKEEKLVALGKGDLFVSPSTGLVALVETNYKFMIFGKSERACVYRLADLIQYDYAEEDVRMGTDQTLKKAMFVMMFRNTEGMYAFKLPVRTPLDQQRMAKYFDKQFGIEKTLRNSFKNAKRQLDAVKAATGAVKAAAGGTLDEDQASQAIDAMDASVYGDRSAWIAKADAALAPYNK